MAKAHLPMIPMRFGRSFRQPMTAFICLGRRLIVWSTRSTAYRGEVLIHASHTRLDPKDFRAHTVEAACKAHGVNDPSALPTGQLIGRALLIGGKDSPPGCRRPYLW